MNWACRCKAETVFALANCQSPGRPHVARALVKAGLGQKSGRGLRAVSEKRPPGLGAQIQNFRARSASNLIHQAGGLAVMAHPGLNRTDDIIPGSGRSRARRH